MSLKNRIQMMVGKAILNAVNDKNPIQLVKISGLADEIQDDVERIQNFGLSSNVPIGGESIVINLGGNKDHSVVIALDHGKYRIKDLKSGETVLYNKTGTQILLNIKGDIVIIPSSNKTIVTGNLEVSEDIKSNTDVIDKIGSLNEVRKDLEAFKIIYNLHTHLSATPGTASAPPLTQVT